MSENARADAEERTAQARAEVEQLRESLRKHKKHEKQLLEESTHMQDRLDASGAEMERLNQLLAAKVRKGSEITIW